MFERITIKICPLCKKEHIHKIIITDKGPTVLYMKHLERDERASFDVLLICPNTNELFNGHMNALIPQGTRDKYDAYEIMNENTVPDSSSSSILSPHDKAILKFGENVITGTTEIVKDFAKTMITLLVGLFASYFAILKFLGIETATETKIQNILPILSIPPILFILSIMAFVVTLIPLLGNMRVSSLTQIEKIRISSITTRRISIGFGIVLFILGMFTMLEIFIALITIPF